MRRAVPNAVASVILTAVTEKASLFVEHVGDYLDDSNLSQLFNRVLAQSQRSELHSWCRVFIPD